VGDWSEQHPGFMEVDLVAHCGASPAGDFLYTLTMIDIYTRWTHLDILPGKQQLSVHKAIRAARRRLPFPLLGIDSDSGGEFINSLLLDYCRQEGIVFTRSRPYPKNDQAHVEQKNWTHVRQLLGYQRLEGAPRVAQINELYRTWGALHNFFCPTLKLQSKVRRGSRTLRKYSPPQTPYQRLRDCPHLTAPQKQQLQSRFQQLNPLHLKHRLEEQLQALFLERPVR
jgi:hypothetical protein